jgi:hypothetical protein
MKYFKPHFTEDSFSQLSRSALPIPHKEISEFWNNLKINPYDSVFDYEALQRYTNRYFEWISSSKRNKLTNLQLFNCKSFTQGTTETFNNFFSKYHMKRFRCFKGEYVYHRLNWRNNGFKWKHLENGEIEENDAVIISLPFSDLGIEHPETKKILQKCNELNVPVCIDCAYMIIAKDINFDFNHKSIDCITFSLSKGFWGVDKLRCGVRFEKKDNDDPINIYNKWSCVNLYSISVAEKIFENFEFDYNWNKFEKKYKDICKNNSLKETNCILFGLGGDKFSDFNRGGNVNRVCVSNALSDLYE